MKVVIPSLLLWAIYIHGTITVHTRELAVIEATRFTDQDGRELLDTILTRLPPEWLREDLSEIKLELQDIKKRLGTLEAKIDRR
jgi:hypothetical protein